ncbi:TRNA-splicing endonuclease subunit Sen2 [Aspergillus sclerotialis]|uniref:tRNA-splicing endonuclease subunit Sen2 n=1 Tax=Aspergillus sclerotialis TaxID=2070753 RepID=A0A3A2ZGG5_9EURO|nr:TRNA-splicing endonuclease subunit Sen2 [Aspergillus sclerotialis]
MASDPSSILPTASVAPAPSPKAESSRDNGRPARQPRPPKPNYKHIYRFPLPLSVHPLPPLIPHNPLSIVSVILSYMTFFISSPSHEVYSAYFDSNTSSVHVTDEKAVRALWEMGFFGKGNLSRSEPSWLEREKKRRGLLGGNTSEDLTSARRSERRGLKLERARTERKIIEERLKAEAAARANGAVPLDSSSPSLPPSENGATGNTTPSTEKFSLRKARQGKSLGSQHSEGQDQGYNASDSVSETKMINGGKTVRFSPVVQEKEFVSESTTLHLPDPSLNENDAGEEPSLKNEEHLQLSNEEAFFLVYGLGALQIFDDKRSTVIPAPSLFSLLRQHSYFPPRESPTALELDDPFIISYAVYHHFRSLGWIVRSGVKFGVDYLLYNRGPVFSHAEFAVVVIPSYDNPYWSETEERRDRSARKQARSWWWLHCVNRVQAQVKKSLVVCYVEVPPPLSDAQANAEHDVGALLAQYRVREISLRRWVPNRTRD